MKNEYRKAKIALKAEKNAQRNFERVIDLPAKALGLSVSSERLQKWRENRKRRSEACLPKNRRCPNCKLVKVSRIRWYKQQNGAAICRSCVKERKFKEKHAGKPLPPLKFTTVVFYTFEPDLEYFSISAMAKVTGLSKSVCHRAFHAGEIPDYIFRLVEPVYPGNYKILRSEMRCTNSSLKQARETLGVSLQDFATHCGWDMMKQYKTEHGKWISDRDANRIMSVIRQLADSNITKVDLPK